MGREITLAGLRLTFEEWGELDADSRAEVLRAFASDDRGLAGNPGASYDLLAAAAERSTQMTQPGG